jgi:hypothetical protein
MVRFIEAQRAEHQAQFNSVLAMRSADVHHALARSLALTRRTCHGATTPEPLRNVRVASAIMRWFFDAASEHLIKLSAQAAAGVRGSAASGSTPACAPGQRKTGRGAQGGQTPARATFARRGSDLPQRGAHRLQALQGHRRGHRGGSSKHRYGARSWRSTRTATTNGNSWWAAALPPAGSSESATRVGAPARLYPSGTSPGKSWKLKTKLEYREAPWCVA